MNYALINDNTVVNIIWLHPMNASEFTAAVPTNGLPVAIGDTYTDGKFYHNGEEVVAVDLAFIQLIKDESIVEVQNELNS